MNLPAPEIISPDMPPPGTPGVLHYKLYGQDGRFVHMTCRDTPDMRRFVEWVARFDRDTNSVETLSRPPEPSP